LSESRKRRIYEDAPMTVNTDTPTRRKTALQIAADARAPYAAKILELEHDRAALIAALEALRGAGEVHMTYHPSEGALFLKRRARVVRHVPVEGGVLVVREFVE
jgi:hypothetical protein